MNYPSKSNVNVAASNLNKFDLSKQVVTTSDFGRIKPIECRYMVPGDKFNIKLSSFTRLAPMVSPTLGKIDCIQRAYFVPIRSMSRDFYKELSNQPFPTGLNGFSTTSRVPRTNMYSFVAMFCSSRYSTKIANGDADVPESYDFFIAPGYNVPINGQIVTTGGFFNFTPTGRKLYDFYNSLGFNISFSESYKNIFVSVFPILAFWKAYFDWVLPSRFLKEYPYSIQGFMEERLSQGNFSFVWNSVETVSNMINYFGRIPLAFYDNDIYTSAWLNPFSPDLSRTSITIPNEIDFGNNQHMDGVTTDSINGKLAGARISANNTASNTTINAFTIQSIGKLQDYLNRGMLAGSKVQDWLLTEFGIRPSTDALDLSTYLGKMSDTIRIGDIMSTADTAGTDGQKLGAYAGQAKGGNVGTFSYHAKEHGYFIITTEIIPKASYYQGLIPEFSMLDITDFFQPEFDNLGVDAVSYKDMFCSSRHYYIEDHPGDSGNIIRPDGIFGFIPRYAKLKTAFDVVSGDFRNRFGEYLKSWYLARDVEKYLVDKMPDDAAVVSMDFCSVDKDIQDWDNIFGYDDTDLDHFYQIFVIENSATRPMLSISDALNPQHPNGSKDVTIKTNGTQE